MELLKRNGIRFPLLNNNGNLICEKKIGQRDTIIFICEKCKKEGSRRVSLFKNKTFSNFNERDFFCEQCNREQNSLDKYGVKNPMQREEVVKILKQSILKKYGVDNPMKCEDIARKSGKTRRKSSYVLRQNYENVEIITPFNEFTGTHKTYKYRCKKCKVIFSYNAQEPSRIPRCPNCIPINYSKPENEIIKFIKSLENKIITNSRNIIHPYEIDIFIPDKRIAIEFNGFYWHGETKLEMNNQDGRKYHLKKHNMCIEKNIQLYQIFEDEWKDENLKEITKSRIKSILGNCNKKIFARKTTVKEINSKEKNKFFLENHLQGKDSASVKIGLFYKNKLVSAMTFCKPKFFKKDDKKTFELSRFASKLNIQVIGGASKLLKYFIINYNPKTIITYSDRRISNGNLYEKLGFLYDNKTGPNYWYFKSGKKYYRFNFRKSNLKKLFPKIYSDDKTEWQIMQEAGYDRIWDCGNDKWILNV